MNGDLLLLNADGPGCRVALVQNDVLTELLIEHPHDRGLVGSIFKGRVRRVLPGMQAAFVDVGVERAAFLYAGDVGARSSVVHGEEEDQEGVEAFSEAQGLREIPRIQDLVVEGQELLVQVAKEPIGAKGARVTSHIALPGRHLVLTPGVEHVGISRRISDEGERARLRDLVLRLHPADGDGFIVRTVAEGRDEEEIAADMDYLLKLWADICARAEQAAAPCLIYKELDLPLRAARDLLSARVGRMLVDDDDQRRRVQAFVDKFMPRYRHALERYDGLDPLFDAYGIELEIDRALERKVWLKSGGYLVFDQSEALTAIDVNTGSFVGHRNLEDTILKVNLEAVKEVVTQLRLRNLGGLIIIDFIDMERAVDREKVCGALRQALASDRARTKVLDISALGLVEMTRKRVRESLARQLTDPCAYCQGRGYVKSESTVCYEVLRELRRQAPTLAGTRVTVRVHPQVADLLAAEHQDYITRLERRFGREIVVEPKAALHLERFEIQS